MGGGAWVWGGQDMSPFVQEPPFAPGPPYAHTQPGTSCPATSLPALVQGVRELLGLFDFSGENPK